MKEKKDLDPMSLEFKVNVHKQKKLSFVQGGDGVFIYQSRLSALMVDGLQQMILEESHNSRYSIHPAFHKDVSLFERRLLVE